MPYDCLFLHAYTSSPENCGSPDSVMQGAPSNISTVEPDIDIMSMWLIGHGCAGPDGPYNPTEDDYLVDNLMKLLIVETAHPNCG